MKLIITGRRLEITEKLRETITKKLGKLNKFFDDETEAHVTLSIEKERNIVEVTIYSKGMIYRAEERNTDMYAAIDRIVDIIERQIRKHKTRLSKSKKLHQSAISILSEPVEDEEKEEKEFIIVKTKKYELKPMSAEEAILQMNLLRHEFFVYQDDVSNATNIVYQRKDGNYGLIETL